MDNQLGCLKFFSNSLIYLISCANEEAVFFFTDIQFKVMKRGNELHTLIFINYDLVHTCIF